MADITIPREARKQHCRSDRDGDCEWSDCPQLRDGEPAKSGRHCPMTFGVDTVENMTMATSVDDIIIPPEAEEGEGEFRI